MNSITLPCTNCSTQVTRSITEYKKSRSGNIFCNRSCSITYNNKNREPKNKCVDCGASVKDKRVVRCLTCHKASSKVSAIKRLTGKEPTPAQLSEHVRHIKYSDKSEDEKQRIKKRVHDHMLKRKTMYIEYLGGSCKLCGYNASQKALVFHHRESTDKELSLSGRSMSWERAVVELDKCDLLCVNCHEEVHEIPINLVSYSSKYRRRIKKQCVNYLGGSCSVCGYSGVALHFHHKNPKDKKFALSRKSGNFETLRPELDKCILLCGNCHFEKHTQMYNK